MALYVRSEEYFRPLKKFLNDFLGDHRDLAKLPVAELTHLFSEATTALSEADARNVLRRSGQRINAALLEAVVVAAMRRAAKSRDMSAVAIRQALTELISNPDISRSTTISTATEENLRSRLEAASTAFDSR